MGVCLCWAGMKLECQKSRKTKRTGLCYNWRCNSATKMWTQWSDTRTGEQRKNNFFNIYSENYSDILRVCSWQSEGWGEGPRHELRKGPADHSRTNYRQYEPRRTRIFRSCSVQSASGREEADGNVISLKFLDTILSEFSCRSAISISFSS